MDEKAEKDLKQKQKEAEGNLKQQQIKLKEAKIATKSSLNDQQ